MLLKFSNIYDVRDELGKGAFGTVMRCIKKTTGEEFAVKKIRTNLSKRDLEDTLYEAEICRKLQHMNIVRLLDSFNERDYLYLVFDLVVGGELMVDIQERKFYSEIDAAGCMQQILAAINYCHGKGIVHRDLKPENILLASKLRGADIKIADFGLSVEVYGDERSRFGTAGTIPYMAPEVLKDKAYGKPVDLWSCGVILYILLVGNYPFYGKNDHEIVSKVRAGIYNYPSRRGGKISQHAKDIIQRMLTKSSHRRSTAADALKHPWICQREYVAPKIHLHETVVNLKKFNARRKFRAAILAAVAAKKFLKMSPSNILKKGAIAEGNGKKSSQSKRVSQSKKHSQGSQLEKEIFELTVKLINACDAGDWRTVRKLCDPQVTTFDSTGSGDIIEGVDFHNSVAGNIPVGMSFVLNTVIESPYVHLLGNEAACIVYVRSTEYSSRGGDVYLEESEETRVWHKRDGKWRNVHYHRGLSFD